MGHSESTTGAPQRPLTNPWVLRPGFNPYLHNIFVLLGLDPDGSQKAYNSAVNRFRQKVSTAAEVRQGYQLGQEDAARAEHLERQEHEYAMERLLAHTAHMLELEGFKEALQAVEKAPLPKLDQLLPLPVRDLSVLAKRLPDLDSNLIESSSEFPRDLVAELLSPRSEEESFFDL